MQGGIAIASFFIYCFWDSAMYYLVFLCLYRSKGTPMANDKAYESWENQLKHKDALITSLVEFHKAQCFFMSTIQIASIVVASAGLLEAANLQQVYNNYRMITSPCYGGSIPVTLVLLRLHTAKHKSWELWLIKTISVMLYIATIVTTFSFDPTAKSSTRETQTIVLAGK